MLMSSPIVEGLVPGKGPRTLGGVGGMGGRRILGSTQEEGSKSEQGQRTSCGLLCIHRDTPWWFRVADYLLLPRWIVQPRSRVSGFKGPSWLIGDGLV